MRLPAAGKRGVCQVIAVRRLPRAAGSRLHRGAHFPDFPNNGNGAFTLLELMVSVAISLLLAVLMISLVHGTLILWQRTQQDLTTTAQAKLVLDMVERDLQAAIFRADGGTWLALDIVSDSAGLTTHGWLLAPTRMKPGTAVSLCPLPRAADGSPPVIADARFGLSGVWLRFITSNVETDGSLPVAVSYQLVRRPVSGPVNATTPAAARYTLFRAAVSASNTFAIGNNVTATGYRSASVNPSVSRSAPTLTNPSSTDALATNVVDFGLWLYLRAPGAGGRQRIFPADGDDITHAACEVGSASEGNRFPDAADVMVRILTESGASVLAEMESGRGTMVRPSQYSTDADWWWAIVEAHSRVYTRRIAMNEAAP